MKKYMAVLFLSLIIFHQFSLVYAAPGGAPFRTRMILRRTEAIIVTSYKFAGKGGVYTGLGMATTHQIYARKLFQMGSYKKAVFHSLRARILAVDLIKLNKKEIMLNEAMFNQEEEKFSKQSPPPGELDQTLKTKEKQILDDNEAAKLMDELGKSLFI